MPVVIRHGKAWCVTKVGLTTFGSVALDGRTESTLQEALELAGTFLEGVDPRTSSPAQQSEAVAQFHFACAAAYLHLSAQMRSDTEAATSLCGHWWKALRACLLGKAPAPSRYFRDCNSNEDGFPRLAGMLANAPLDAAFLRKIQVPSDAIFRQGVFQASADLIGLEREYRNSAIAVAQVGIGFGGMLVGFLGLLAGLVSLALSLVLR